MARRKSKNFSGSKEMGLRFRQFRESKGLKQSEIAVLLGYKNSAPISKIELGEQSPALGDLVELDRNFHIDLHQLITGNPSPGEEELVQNRYEFYVQFLPNCIAMVDDALEHRDRLRHELSCEIESQKSKKPSRTDQRYLQDLRTDLSNWERMVKKTSESDEWLKTTIAMLEKKRRK
jgi:transcriptional regulator with XRE-family HTH domain